ncbi:MAG TPA: hypothetical protein VGZ90_13280 [Puia sp.]|nr:hypothetical protein [Puia sp.]
MPCYYKRVDAEQFVLTSANKQGILRGENIQFQSTPVKHDSGRFFVMIHHKEAFVKVEEGQWLVKHDNGIWETVYPDRFKDKFVSEDVVNQNIEDA